MKIESSLDWKLDSKRNGKKIILKKGIYRQNLTVDENLTLQARKRAKTKLVPSRTDLPLLQIGPSPVVVELRGISLDSSDLSLPAVVVTGESTLRTEDLTVNGGRCPVLITGNSTAILKRATISDSIYGIVGFDSSTLKLKNSKVIKNKDGLLLFDKAEAFIDTSIINQNGNGIIVWDKSRLLISTTIIKENSNYGLIYKKEGFSPRAKIKVRESELRGNGAGDLKRAGEISASIGDIVSSHPPKKSSWLKSLNL